MKGLTASVAPSGLPTTTSPLPAALTLSSGASYTLTADGKKGLSFTHWSSDETTASIAVLLNQNTTLVAFYMPTGVQTLSVVAKLLNGKSVVGVELDTINHQVQQASSASKDTIPANFTGKYGDVYTFTALSAASVEFRYWNGDQSLTNASLTITLTGNTTLTANFQQLAFPYKHSVTGNHTINVIAHTMDGGLVVGAYFQVRIHGVWNQVADGYTPGSITVPDGSEELVMYHCAQQNCCADKFFVYRFYNNTNPHTLTRWQYFNLSNDMTFNSFYEIIPASEAVHVTIEAMNSTGPIFVNCTCGSPVTIYNLNGTPIAQSLEPYSFWLWKGQHYTVTVGDLPGYTFTGWTTGSTSYTIGFTAQPQGTDPYYQYFAATYVKKP